MQDPPHKTNKPFLRKRMINQSLRTTFANEQSFRGFYNDIEIDGPMDECELCEFHSPEYVEFLKKAYECAVVDIDPWLNKNGGLVPLNFYKTLPPPQTPTHKLCGYYGSDTMTPIYSHTYQNALLSATQAKTAGEVSKTTNIVYALTTSPGHHAKVAEYGGYCFFNNALIAASSMKKKHGLDVVYVLDLDYHAGNGTGSIITEKEISDIVPLSIHSDPTYDYPSFEGHSTPGNYVLKGRVTKDVYIRMLHDALSRTSENFGQKKGLVIAFGGDTWKNDPDVNPNTRFALKVEDYVDIGRHIGFTCYSMPIVVTQEGGYDMNVIGKIVKNFLEGLST